MTFLDTISYYLLDPKPDLDWTIDALVSTINSYIERSLKAYVNTPMFGISGKLVVASTGTIIPYEYVPAATAFNGGYTSYTITPLTAEDYKSAITQVLTAESSPSLFWENFFKLIAKAVLSIKLQVKPFLQAATTATLSEFSATTLLMTPSYYQDKGNAWNASKVYETWTEAAKDMYYYIDFDKISEASVLWELVSDYVKATMETSTYHWRYYTGFVNVAGNSGTFTGYIYGSMTFD